MGYARRGDELILHGSARSRLLEEMSRGAPVCVEVTLVEESDANVYEIEVDDEDLGKVIGKGGKTARAIRALVNAVAPRRGKRTLVEILE